jgi:outer membrane protein assembly factor BamB
MEKAEKQMPNDQPVTQSPLRVWPGVIIIALQWLLWYGIPLFFPGTVVIGVFAGLLGGLAVMVWWAFFSRAPLTDRWTLVVWMIVALVVSSRMVHDSIGTGMQGMMYFIYAVPLLSLAFVLSVVISSHFPIIFRRVTMVAAILLACGVWIFFRSGGITGEGRADLGWRWTETPEERLLAETGEKVMTPVSVRETSATGVNWPGFRGPHRDAIVHDLKIRTDWSTSPPVELWRRPIGPGCSSFAVHDNLLYTQEQRGEYEIVSCYYLNTGDPVWFHRDSTRFWDSHAGAGPRGTPTFHNGYLYTLGATGVLNVLDAINGSVIWSRNAGSDTKVEIPGWGFSSSPLVVGDMVVVAITGTLAAYDRMTGDIRWIGSDGGAGYSSPHLITIDGVNQILLMSEVGATSYAQVDGGLLWKHLWEEERIVQPAVIRGGDLLLSAGGLKGIRRILVKQGPEGWNIQERWTSEQLKPNFNDIVIHKGHAFGFNGPMLTCIDIEDGQRKWRGGRYGGQLILLADQDLLLILSEMGELALVETVPDKFTELARFPAIEGKTWNHPVLAGNILVVRNTQEMAAFRLQLAGE